MSSNLFNKYIWLVDTIRRAGAISFAEISEEWHRSTLYEGKRLALRTFHNHREAIEELFGLHIACDERTNRYYIADCENLQTNDLASWLLNSFSVGKVLREAKSLKGRILVENVQSAQNFLIDLLEAMRENRQIVVSYQPFYGDVPFDLLLRPLFVKLYQRRWYLYADKPDDSKIKLYALDRMQSVRITDDRFIPPADLDPENYLFGAFGVAIYDDIKPCRIRVCAYRGGVKYLQTLPLHHSQQEVETGEGYAVFEYWVAPTFEFYQAILARHFDVEILSPIAVRKELEQMLVGIILLYERHKQRIIFLDFDGVLNTERHIAALRADGKPLSDKYGYIFDSESVANLERIIEQTGASVVVTSSWRLEGAERMAEMWRERNLPGKMVDVTDECCTPEEFIPGSTPEDFAHLDSKYWILRGREIKYWLHENAPDGCHYVILDDEEDILPEQRSNFIRINPICGITEENVREAIAILNR